MSIKRQKVVNLRTGESHIYSQKFAILLIASQPTEWALPENLDARIDSGELVIVSVEKAEEPVKEEPKPEEPKAEEKLIEEPKPIEDAVQEEEKKEEVKPVKRIKPKVEKADGEISGETKKRAPRKPRTKTKKD